MIKRTFDCLSAATGLVLLLPLLLIVAACIKATSRGPVFFGQRRVGRHFRPFTIYKFRTMEVDAERGGQITWGGSHDPRITPIGRLLRATKLDELPQLFNVIKGDMSLVGPRPEVPVYVDMFRRDYQEILRVRPGITDLASLKFRDEASVLASFPDPQQAYVTRLLPEKIELAKQYVYRSSLRLDLTLILRTLASIVWRAKPAPTGGPRRRSVLLVGNFLYASSGIYGVADELAVQLTGSGWDVLTTSSKTRRAQRLFDMVLTAWSRRHTYSVAQVDVFSGHAFVWAEAVCRTLRAAGKPYVLTLHGGALPEFAHRWPKRVRRLLASAKTVTTPSQYLLEKMSSYRPHLELCPNPIHLAHYPYRQRVAIQPRLIWLRTFHEVYNPSLAVQVLALLRPMYPDVELLMFGPVRQPEVLADVHAIAEELGVADRLVVHGPVPKKDVGSHLAQGDIFLNTTNVDNTPVSVMEAMACGLCVVSTNVGGVPYLVRDGEDGLLVPPEEPEAMAAAVRRLLETPGLSGRLSSQARERISALDWARVLPQWHQILQSAGSRSAVSRRRSSRSSRARTIEPTQPVDFTALDELWAQASDSVAEQIRPLDGTFPAVTST